MIQATPLLSFHGEQIIKDMYLTRLKGHYEADEIIKGTYWQHGKGCAVGCTIHSNLHRNYETQLGIPYILAYIQDSLFELMTNEQAKEFPVKFLEAIPVGVNLKNVWVKLIIWLLIDFENGVINIVELDTEKKLIKDIADVFKLSLTKKVSNIIWNNLIRNLRDYRYKFPMMFTQYCMYVALGYTHSIQSLIPFACRSSFPKELASEKAYKISEKLIFLLKNEK